MPNILAALPYAFLPSGSPLPDSERARGFYLLLDAAACRIGHAIANNGVNYRERAARCARDGAPSLAAQNREIADALVLDARLAALPALYAWASIRRAGSFIDTTWVNWYATLLRTDVGRTRFPARMAAE